jgi:20S proteasome alpha/beta subunit
MMMMMMKMRRPFSVPALCCLGRMTAILLVLRQSCCEGSSSGSGGSWGMSVDDRHAFSLSTFTPQGHLQQVDYAMEAAALGTPILLLRRPQEDLLLMASPQASSQYNFMQEDDGTARFVRITAHLLIAHTGIAADGRVLCAAAQELAIQHEYIYDEEIPIDVFLEEMALLYQEYTMKPNTRPFGATMIVAHYHHHEETSSSSSSLSFYRIDPSGAVQSLLAAHNNDNNSNYAVINGGDKFQNDHQLWNALQDISQDPKPQTITETRHKLVQALVDALTRASVDQDDLIPTTKTTTTTKQQRNKETPQPKEDNDDDDADDLLSLLLQGEQEEEYQRRVPTTLQNVKRILTASICRNEGMVMERFQLSRGKLMVKQNNKNKTKTKTNKDNAATTAAANNNSNKPQS